MDKEIAAEGIIEDCFKLLSYRFDLGAIEQR